MYSFNNVGSGHYDGVTAYNPPDTFANTWVGETFGGGGSFDSNYFQNNLVNNDWMNVASDNYVLDHELQQNLFGDYGDDYSWTETLFSDEGGGYDPDWFSNFNDKETEFINTDFSDPDLGYTMQEAAVLEDITSITPGEANIIEEYGVLKFNEDGSINEFDSNESIAMLNEAANNPDISPFERREILATATQLAAAADAGLDQFELTDPNLTSVATPEYRDAWDQGNTIPYGAEPYQSIEGEKYIDPFSPNYVQNGNVAGPEGKVPWLGNTARTYLSSVGTGNYQDPTYMTPAMKAAQPQQPLNAAMFNDPGFLSTMNVNEMARANTQGQLAADKYGINAYGEPNQMINGVPYAVQPTFASRVDAFTDGVRDIGGMILSPINWATDKVGLGFNKVGQMIGNNPVGRGFNNFGNLVDNTGDYLFGDSDRNSLLGTVMNMPDSLANMGQGIAYGNWDLAKAGALGFLGGPASIAGNLASPLVSGLVDVAGIDQLKLNIGGAGGGGGNRGQKKQSKSKARKSVPLVGNRGKIGESGGNPTGPESTGASTGGGSGGVTIGDDGVSYDLKDAEGRNAYAEAYGEGALRDRLNDLNLKTVSSGQKSDKSFEASDADKSTLGDSIAANQGNPSGVKRAPKAQKMDVIDKLAGPGPQVDFEEQSFNQAESPSSVFNPPEDINPFAYEKGEEAFA
jgi:hypothetical protein